YNPWGYCGEYRDKESGLIYLRNRYYDSSTGRFINEDTYWNIDNMIYGESENEKGENVNISYGSNNKIELKNKFYYFDLYIDKINNINTNYFENTDNYIYIVSDNTLNSSNIKYTLHITLYPKINNIIGSGNLYIYCINNPTRYKDSSGNSPAVIGAEVGSAAGPVGTFAGVIIGAVAGAVVGDFVGEAIVNFAKKSKSSDKDKANDIPSWAEGKKPKEGESGKDFAKRLMDGKYGEGNYKTGPGSEYNQLKKYGDRGGK
ncbi:MAG: RHS repeat-associated core domain-containing protein, partial [Clostridia bacterium]|nr:RHS repeat-associated core domain-containing protein [Clostridia bacterium]